MFDTISDPHTTPRNFAISSSVLLHFILILIIPLMRFNRAPTLVFHGAVYSANNKLIFPTPRQVVLSPRFGDSRRAGESGFSASVHRASAVDIDSAPPAILPAALNREILATDDTIEPRSFAAKSFSLVSRELQETDTPAPPLPPPPAGITEHLVISHVEPLKLIRNVKPQYPAIARIGRVQGEVEIDAMVNEEGAVENMTVVRGHPLLNDAALECVRQWRYSPAMLNGVPVRAPIHVTVRFELRFQ